MIKNMTNDHVISKFCVIMRCVIKGLYLHSFNPKICESPFEYLISSAKFEVNRIMRM